VKKAYKSIVKPTSDSALEPETNKSSTVQVVSTALTLLEQISELQPVGLSSLSQEAGLSLNQTFRLLATLESSGYLVRDDQKRYSLGAKLHVLGSRAPIFENLIQASAPHMDALSELSGESVLLAVRVGLERMVIAKREAKHSLRVEWAIGSKLPLYVGGLGMALLAFSSQSIQKEVLKQKRIAFTNNTLVSNQALELELNQIRQNQIRVSIDDYAVGEFAIAAPIVVGEILFGAINIAGFTARLTTQKQKTYQTALKKAAREIAAVLG
jgi:DNA-binding IclR family transcriptional regulator